MLETIELRASVTIDGKPVNRLSYDIEKISSEQFIEAEILAGNAAARKGMVAAKIVELDAGFHYYLGVMAILAANPAYSVQDIERIKGPDVLKVMRIGRNFMTADAEGAEDAGFASTEDTEDDPLAEDALERYPQTLD